MVGEFSIMHWLVVLIVVLMVFGPKRIPDIAKALGTGIRDFKKALNEVESTSTESKPITLKETSPKQLVQNTQSDSVQTEPKA
jgi:sec-independent protein translocase protein TatA